MTMTPVGDTSTRATMGPSTVRERWFSFLQEILASPAILYAGLVVFCGFAWWSQIAHFDLKIAWEGFSPIAYVYKALNSSSFLRDFPSGIENYDMSAFMHVYTLAYQYLGITPETLLPGIIAVEFVVMAWATFTLTRTLVPDAPRIIPAFVIILVIASWAREMNLAHFGQPFLGQFYNVTDALRIFAIIMILRGRPIASGFLLGAAFTTHPMMGIMGATFILAMLLVTPREIFQGRVLAGGAIFLVIAAGWTLAVISTGVVSGGGIPSEEWFNLTKLMSSHWYAVASGLFTVNHEREFLPFLSFMTLLAYFFGRFHSEGRLGDADVKILAGFIGLFTLVGLGVLFSTFPISPALVKLALHRANDLVISIGLVYIGAGLWGEIGAGAPWRRALAMPMLISPFIARPGYPLVFSLLLVSPAWMAAMRGDWRRRNLIVTCLAGSTVGLVIIYALSGYVGKWTSNAYTGGESLLRAASQYGPGMLALILALLVLFLCCTNRHILELFAVAAFIACAVFWVRYQSMDREEAARDLDYKRAQMWARDNTPSGSLFMTDPGLFYGWRDYSRRSSFGTVREWLYTSWGYNSNVDLYREGMRRFAEFGVRLDGFVRGKPKSAGSLPLLREVQRRYYEWGDERRAELAARYGIDYFVFEKDRMGRTPARPVAYENEHFLIVAATGAGTGGVRRASAGP